MNVNTKNIIREYAESLLIAFILAMIIRAFIVQAYKIPTGSMIPTLRVGDRILVSKFIYKFREPKRGEIIVFKYPEDPSKAFIKRLIGFEQEEVLIKNGRIFIDNNEVIDPKVAGRYYYNRGDYGEQEKPYHIPANSFFALGDNSANSRDSRYWGPVPQKNLIGKAILIYWPISRIRLIE